MQLLKRITRYVIDQKKCISCGECLKTCPVKGAIKGIHISHIEEQKEIINLVVDTLEARIEADQDEIKHINGSEVFKLDMSAEDIIEKAREILPNDELIGRHN